ncbi:hypothetical protein BGX28_002801 [Mortierella sp. GBA30]|nr:hypothetical protein BGX28_002801 [Mortierella sp. GBA30]
MTLVEEIINTAKSVGPAKDDESALEPFLGMSREQCHMLLSLYFMVDPSLAPSVPTLFPAMAQKFKEDRMERNSIVSKLERGPEKYTEEVLNLQEIQKAVVEALLESDMDLEKARAYLKMTPLKENPMEQMTIQEVLTNGVLLGGVRSEDNGKKASPLSAPNFREAKKFYDYAFEKFKFSMAAVQLASFYLHEHKECQGANCLEGEDPELISLEYYIKAAELGNPMAMHKVAWHYDQTGNWHKAIEWYNKAADEGYPDSAHNLGMIYQEGSTKVEPHIEIDLPRAIEYYRRGFTYGYASSATQLGRVFFMMVTDRSLRELMPSTDRAYSSDPREYLMTAISWFDKSSTLGDTEALQLLGMIYGSKEFGMYNVERAQNLFELALIASNGGAQAYEYLCRTLNARRAIIQEREAAEGGSSSTQVVDGEGFKTCASGDCDNKETKKDEFQRCAGCKKKFYCSRLCQVNDWKKGHKTACKKK